MRTVAVAAAALAVIVVVFFLLRSAAPAGSDAPSLAPTATDVSLRPGTTLLRPAPTARPAASIGAPDGSGSDGASHVRLVVHGAWGSGPGQFGRRHDPETRGEGPASLAVDAHGNLLVLDQINHRVARFTSGGAVLAPLPIHSDTVEDLLPLKRGLTAVVDRLAEGNVQLYDAQGKLVNEITLKGRDLPEGGGVTGLFTDGDGDLYAEREHRQLVRIADAQGISDPARPGLPGRPTRDGRLYLNGAIVDRAAGQVVVRAVDRDGQPLWEAPLSLGAPVLYIALLDSDAAGGVYLGAITGRESAQPPYAVVDEQLVLVALTSSGVPRASLTLPETPSAEESFRELTVGDDGTIYRMHDTAAGVDVEAIHL